jgi:imidazolonepropionase-like amidohydrolase
LNELKIRKSQGKSGAAARRARENAKMKSSDNSACELVINNAKIFDGSALLQGLHNVGIAGDRIRSVSSSPISGSRQIEARGRFLMPGLIDCHIHLLNMWTAKDEATMAADIETELPKRLNDFLTAGVTTVKSVGDSEDDILRVRARLASGELAGPRLLATGAAFCAPGSHPATTIYGQNPWLRYRSTVETDSPERAREAVRRLAGKKVDAIKVVHQGGCRHGSPYFFKIESMGLNVQILKLEKAVLGAIIDEAQRHGLKVTVHTVDANAAIEALEAGVDGLEHGVMEHRLKDDQVAELLLRNRASYVPTLWTIRFDEKTAEARYANLKQVADAGVRVALGTDSFCGFGKFGENTIEEAERSAQAGIGASQILRMATKDAAEHLGMDDLGVVAPGKLADLLLLEGDPTTSIGALRKLSIVIQNGAIVVDNAHIA